MMTFENANILLNMIRQKNADRTDSLRPFVIAIDGRAAAGKTTLAQQLAKELGASVVHMDDFFLPPELRSKERYRTPGGNVHKERFKEEVLPFVGKKVPFCYRRFDCHTMKYSDCISVPETAFRIVEGSYSLHPEFGRYADLTVFVTILKKEQMTRIVARNGEDAARVFTNKWIPLEEAYFSAFGIAENADMIIGLNCG